MLFRIYYYESEFSFRGIIGIWNVMPFGTPEEVKGNAASSQRLTACRSLRFHGKIFCCGKFVKNIPDNSIESV
jgi:hypothetical protein